MITKVNDENYKAEVLDSDEIVLVKLGAPWCGPCKMLDKVLESCSNELPAKIVSVDIDESVETSASFGLSSIPAIRLIQNGEVIGEANGAMSKQKLIDFIESNIPQADPDE